MNPLYSDEQAVAVITAYVNAVPRKPAITGEQINEIHVMFWGRAGAAE